MSNHTLMEPPPIDTSLRVLQLNTRRSSAVVHSLLNDSSTSQFHFLLIQEPYIFPNSSSPISHPSWVPLLPDIPKHHRNSSADDSTVKTLIYVNKSIPSTALKPVNTFFNCVTAVSYAANEHSLTLISSYAPPRQTHKLDPLRELLRRSPSSPTNHILVGMDCNLHHPLWNPPSYRHTHREADDLIGMMTESGLSLRSQCGVPTFYPSNPSHAHTTIDLTWVSPSCVDCVVECSTDVNHIHSHLLDHAGVISTINFPHPLPSIERTYRNWKKFDAVLFKDTVASHLQPTLPLLCQPALDQTALDHHTYLLTQAVTASMNVCVPRLPLKPGAKRWWDKDLLNPLKAAAQGSRRLYQRRRDEQSRLAYTEVSMAY